MRTTEHRTELLSILQKGGVFTAKSMHAKLPHMDLATIYRNLKKFVEEGIARELPLSKDTLWYEFVQDEHHHAVCDDCGKVLHFEVASDKLRKALDIDESKFAVQEVEIIVRGRCL